MKTIQLLFLLFVPTLLVGTVHAQTAASVNWALTEAEGVSVTSATGGATGISVRSDQLEVRDYTGDLSDDSAGPLGPYQRWWLGGEEWPVESMPDPARYVEFVVTPEAGGTFQVMEIALVLNAGGTGEMRASLFYDTDPAFSAPTFLEGDIAVSRDAVGNFSYTIDENLTGNDSLYFRVFPWLGGGNASATRYLFLQDVTISGTGTEGEPEPVEGVNWALTESDTTSVTESSEGLGGVPARASDLVVRDYDGDLRDANDAIGPLGPFQRWWRGDGVEWPVEDDIDPNRYVEFAAGADDGLAFEIDEISMYVHGDGTSEMMASVFYSTNADFSDPIALEENFNAGDGDFGGPTRREYGVDVTVPAGDSIYVRVFPYLGGGNPSAGRYLLLQDVTISGSAQAPPPELEGVLWSLSASDTTSVTATSENLGGAMARSSDVEVRDYDGDLRDANDAVGPYGPFQRWWRGDGIEWPVEDNIDPSRYIEFAAGPSDGFAFDVDSLSVYIHGDGTSEMMASVFYSTNADFSDPVALEENFNAGDGDFGGPTRRSYSLDVAVLPGDSIYVRVFPYLGGGNASATRYLLLQEMAIYGEAIDPSTVAIEDRPEGTPFFLYPSFPNPTHTTATVRYELAEAADVQLDLFNVLGQRVGTLMQGLKAPGSYDVTVDASALAPGLYFVRMQAGSRSRTQHFIVSR